jgi:hypothetical protein
MDKQESLVELLLAQRETTWDALKQWTDDLNKLIYWLALVGAAATAASAQALPLALATLVAALPVWVYMYLRGSYWYGVNLTVLEHVEHQLNSRIIEKHLSSLPAFVQARAGCDGNMSLTGPLRAPWLALVGAMLTLLYILVSEMRIIGPEWQGYPHASFLIFWSLMAVGILLEFFLFCNSKLPKLKKLPDELARGLVTQETHGAHNTAAQAGGFAAA